MIKAVNISALHQFQNITLSGGYNATQMVEQQFTQVNDQVRTSVISPPQAMQVIRVIGQRNTDYMTICEIEVYRQKGKT